MTIKVIKVNKPTWKGFVFVEQSTDAMGLVRQGRTGYAEIADPTKLDATETKLNALTTEELAKYLED